MNAGNKHDASGWNDLARAYRQAAPYINVTYVLIFSIVLFGLIGYWLDREFGSLPVFFIGGLFFGLGIGFYSFFKTIKKMDRQG